MSEQDPINVKLILLGDSSVGKTSLIRTFVEGNFLTNEQPTIGFDFKPFRVTVDDELVQLNIWDTAGAERYSGYLTPSFYRNAHGALYVYDISVEKTLNGIDYWLRQTEQFAGVSMIKMLIGNKIDLPDRQVTKRDGSDFARRTGMLFIETSAKTSENVRDAFIELLRKILQDPEFRATQSPKGITLNQPPESKSSSSECYC